MSFIHDIIKIKYTRLGYLPNYPYHLISDTEMFEAFIGMSEIRESDDPTFFDATYPNPFATQDFIYKRTNGDGEVVEEISLNNEYARLRQYIIDEINKYLGSIDKIGVYEYTLPDWIYTYMLGEVIYSKSPYKDIHDLLTLFNIDNVDHEFTQDACVKCYQTSLKYISTLTSGIRPPTVFGEPHVIKQLRLEV